MQKIRIAGDRVGSKKLAATRDTGPIELRLMRFEHVPDQLIHIQRLKMRLRHFRKLTKTADDIFEVGDFREQGRGAFAKSLFKLLLPAFPCPEEVFDRQLQWEERVFELVREAPRKLAPRRHALRLN